MTCRTTSPNVPDVLAEDGALQYSENTGVNRNAKETDRVIDFMVDVIATLVLGLFFGVLMIYGKGNRILGAVVTMGLGALIGYLLLETVPMDLQSIQYLLQLTGSQELNLAYQQGGLQGLVSIAPYVKYYGPAVGAVVSGIGYDIAVLGFGNRKKRR